MVKFYKVGGCVRDSILGVRSKDIDFSVEAPSYEAMKQEIQNRGGQIFLENPEYLTIRAKVPKFGAADFVLCRKDGNYSDGRRPDSVEHGKLEDDLARRDFTMNAIAEDEEGRLIDLYKGRDHIMQKEIWCVGQAQERFREDYLRLLRAMRFAITKEMSLSAPIIFCLHNSLFVDGLKTISVERVREEVYKMFMFDTLRSFRMFEYYNKIRDVVFDYHGLKLKPTLER